ncbi:MAG: hypothetical protein DWQ31_04490 [Planctomycetota bacterium]|nr:MAG: hypothetical protein DWQ31_04490 [Planctomycetota bacterium]REJ95588.1 MAG: hypothetical protein DWQ35_06320 [Planctomycetota bacterium]REK22634.1 MAG: hypothetical protein DWQ42_16755 [Planctomycetota bacterium]
MALSLVLSAGAARPCLAATGLSAVDQQFIDGLLARELFSLAETFCQRELAREDLGPRRRAELTVELARTHALRARQMPAATRDAAWQRVFDLLRDARADQAKSPFLYLVRRQHALVYFARGELIRQEAEVLTTAQPNRERARVDLRQAIAELKRLLADLSLEIATRSRAARESETKLALNELRNLRARVRFHLAEALVSQGMTYARGSNDRTNSIMQARDEFRTLAERDEPVDWASRLALARCDRMLQKYPEALKRLAMLQSKVPPSVAAAARLERARVELDRGRATAALEILQERSRDKGLASEWDFELLRTLLTAKESEQDPAQRRRLDFAAGDVMRRIEARYGLYWTRRAEALLGRHIAASSDSEDAAVMARAAANFYRSEKLDEAIATYDRAAALAREKDDEQQAFDLAFTAASIEHQRGRFDAAMKRYRELALADVEHARAAEAHLLATFDAAMLARGAGTGSTSAAATDRAAIDRYVELLEEHLEHWSEGETVEQTRIWLAGVLASRRAWSEALAHLRSVPASSPLYGEAVQITMQTHQAHLASLRGSAVERRRIAREVAADYARRLFGNDGQLPTPLRAIDRNVLLAWARTQLKFLEEGYDEVEQQLRRALRDAGDADDAWRTSAGMLLVWSLAAQPRRLADAVTANQEITLPAQAEAEPPQQGLPNLGVEAADLTLAVDRLRRAASGARRRDLAQFQLALETKFEELWSGVAGGLQRRLAKAEAAALVDAGEVATAAVEYAQLAAALPDDAAVQLGYARILSHRDIATDKDAWQRALAQWRLIERRSTKATADWFDAKYHQALAHHRLGNSAQALRILKLTAALHPELGGAESRRRFEALRAECENG